MALGNTGVSSANDSAALFYNPAVLANVKGWWIDYAAWTIEFSDGFTIPETMLSLASTTFPYINRNGLSDSDKDTFLSKTNPYLRGSAGMTLTASIMDEGLSFAGAYIMETIITTTQEGNIIYQRDDLIKKYGVSIPLGMGSLVVGIARSDIDRRVASDNSSDSIPDWSDRYTGSGYDVGILYRMANKARVTWGLVAYNYGGVTYGDSDIEDSQSIALGVSMNHELGIFKIMPAIDIREINSSAAKNNTVHAGLEIGMFPNSTGGSYLTYRIGYNQGYATQGAELNFFNHSMIIGYATYSEEVGTGTEKSESKRTVYYFSMGF